MNYNNIIISDVYSVCNLLPLSQGMQLLLTIEQHSRTQQLYFLQVIDGHWWSGIRMLYNFKIICNYNMHYIFRYHQ